MNEMSEPSPDEKTYWLDNPKNVTKVFWAVVAVCGILFVADAFYHKHVELEAESYFGFYGIYVRSWGQPGRGARGPLTGKIDPSRTCHK